MPDAKGSILIVEDEKSIRDSLAQVFSYLGYRTRSAESGIGAVIEIRSEVPDILLSDLNMPGMSGFELLSIVRRRFPAMHVVAMSGVYSEEQMPYGVTADAFYQKGGGMAALLKAVETRPWPARVSSDVPEPIWIQRNGHDASGEEYVMMACPDCFRTFPQPIDGSARMIFDTKCVFCHSLILYAIVDPSSVVFPSRYLSSNASSQPVN
jgi:CheY-like chemotaxis protein